MATTLDSGAVSREGIPPPSMSIQDAERAVAIRLSLLDGFELRIDGILVEVALSAQRLLAFLAVQERPCPCRVRGILPMARSQHRARPV